MCGSALRWTPTAPVTQAKGEHAAARVQTASEAGARVPPAPLPASGARGPLLASDKGWSHSDGDWDFYVYV